jgi:hypothetical protein
MNQLNLITEGESTSIVKTKGGRVFVCTINGLLFSDDSGINWEKLELVDIGKPKKIKVNAENELFLIAEFLDDIRETNYDPRDTELEFERLYSSKDNGLSWKLIFNGKNKVEDYDIDLYDVKDIIFLGEKIYLSLWEKNISTFWFNIFELLKSNKVTQCERFSAWQEIKQIEIIDDYIFIIVDSEIYKYKDKLELLPIKGFSKIKLTKDGFIATFNKEDKTELLLSIDEGKSWKLIKEYKNSYIEEVFTFNELVIVKEYNEIEEKTKYFITKNYGISWHYFENDLFAILDALITEQNDLFICSYEGFFKMKYEK